MDDGVRKDADAHLLGLWGLPATVVDAVAGHTVGGAARGPRDLPSTVALAHAVVEGALGPVCDGPGDVTQDDLDGDTTALVQRWRRRH